jgi:CTP:molybdopterin cytidylyltransferase MocA
VTLVATLMAEYQRSKADIVTPMHDERCGHPLVFSSRYFDEVLHSFDGIGLKGLLESHADAIHRVQLSDPAMLFDIDYPRDYERALALRQELAEHQDQGSL